VQRVVSMPASGLKAQVFKLGALGETGLSGATAHFPNRVLRAGESHYRREKTKFPNLKLAETVELE
jgi:hypothetical protein